MVELRRPVQYPPRPLLEWGAAPPSVFGPPTIGEGRLDSGAARPPHSILSFCPPPACRLEPVPVCRRRSRRRRTLCLCATPKEVRSDATHVMPHSDCNIV